MEHKNYSATAHYYPIRNSTADTFRFHSADLFSSVQPLNITESNFL